MGGLANCERLSRPAAVESWLTVVIKTNLSFSEWSSKFGDAKMGTRCWIG
jgi:hypothetical protein